jgi:deazaflavin-dependent oxidoreductase (nitroreductase family)
VTNDEERNADTTAPSVDVPPRGTRGTPIPRFLARFGNRMMLRQFRRKGEARTQGGVHAFVLETSGAKTGARRSALLGYFEEGDDAWLVIASAVGGARHPAWLHNLAKTPDATVEFGDGRRVDVRAETLAGPELAQAWERIAREGPEYVKYQTKTDREIPVVRLRARRLAAGAPATA